MKIASCAFMRENETVKIVIGTAAPAFAVRLRLGGAAYADEFNLAEPYDRKTHVFRVPEAAAAEGAAAELLYRRPKRLPLTRKRRFSLPRPDFADPAALLREYDSGLTVSAEEKEALCEGLTFTKFTCADRNGAPVILTLLETDLRHTDLYIGTPGDGTAGTGVKATIPDMAAAAEKNGKTVLAAVNGDFFEILGDHHPSGLCVKNGRVLSNVRPERPFIGVTETGAPVITDQTETPGIAARLRQAAAGMQMLVKDGAVFDFAPLEPFSYMRHPRTAAGVTKDGRVLLLEADGRIPAHSNGATLTDLALFMIRLGADRALNLDGGGSSAVYTKENGALKLRTVPADLFFPNDMLIRKDYNAILIIRKENS